MDIYRMPRYTVEGFMSGTVYAGGSIDTALGVLTREIKRYRIELQGPSDLQLHCDGAVVETELGPDCMRVAVPKPKVEMPPREPPKNNWRR